MRAADPVLPCDVVGDADAIVSCLLYKLLLLQRLAGPYLEDGRALAGAVRDWNQERLIQINDCDCLIALLLPERAATVLVC
jgi:hypothetical protein